MKLIVLFMLICSTLTGCNSTSENKELNDQIKDGVIKAKSEKQAFHFASVANFDWDELYILRPYTRLESFSEQTGIDTKPIQYCGIELFDHYNVIAFVKNKQIITYIEYSIANGDFTVDQVINKFSKEDATFNITENKEGIPNQKNAIVFYPES